MFENLSTKLDRAFKTLKGQGSITEINVAQTIKEVRRALVDADVNYKVAKTVTDKIKDEAMGRDVLIAVSPGQLMVKIVHEELTELMGGEKKDINNFGILTGKLFEYLAANKPIICIGPIHGDADRIIDECGAGRVFHYSGYELMTDHLMQMSKTWKINPNLDLPFINYTQYSRRALTEKLSRLLVS